jgi:hypothetical protein
MRMKYIFQFATLALSGFCLAQAASFTLGPSASVGVIVGSSSTEQILAGGEGIGSASFSGVQNGGGTNYMLNVLADATGGPGDLRAYSSYSLLSASSYYTGINAVAVYFDELTINAPGQAGGAPGSVTFTMQIDGTTTANAYGTAGFITQVGSAPATQVIPSFQGGYTVSDTIGIQFGVPFDVYFWLEATTGPANGALSATADYSSTAMLTSIQVMDGNGSAISNPLFTSASGLEYTVDGVAPEPGSWLLGGVGLAAIGVFRCLRSAS